MHFATFVATGPEAAYGGLGFPYDDDDFDYPGKAISIWHVCM